jgi:hypothetical protein
MSLESRTVHTFSAMTLAISLLTFSFASLAMAILVNSSKLYSGISNIANLDKSGSIIFSKELAVANTQDVSFNFLVFLTLVSEIIPVSIKCNKAVWSITLIFSILNNIDNCSNEHSYYSYDKWIIILVFLYKIARFNSPSLQSVCKSCRHLPAIIWLPGLRVCD